MRIHVVKIGGSVISDKSKPFSIDYAKLEAIAEAIGECIDGGCIDKLVLVHGGGGFGHYVVQEFGSVESSEAFLRVVEVMREMNSKVVEVLRLAGLKAFGIDTHAIAYMRRGKLFLDTATISAALRMGLIPVLYGDAVLDVVDEVFRIASGDELAWELAYAFRAERLVFVTRVPGVLRRGEVVRKFSLSRDLQSMDEVAVQGHDVTGGMRTKLVKGIGRIAGVGSVYIVGHNPRVIKQALCSEPEIGTQVVE